MTFIWPVMLVFLILVPLAGVAYIVWLRGRRRLAERYKGFSFLQGSPNQRPGYRRHVPPALFLTGFALLTFALARPQTLVSLPRIEGKVILAFDVSGSMAAGDILPTRLDAAKAAAAEFVKRQPATVQIGVVAFTDSGYAVQIPTNDQSAILAAINRLAPQRGTSLANGILGALNTINAGNGPTAHLYSNLPATPTPTPTPVPQGTYTSAVIVMLTDGENNENPDPLNAAQTAASQGVRIYTIGVGSPGGTTLHVNGFTVHTQLDEAMLQQIAQYTGGVYYNAQTQQDLSEIYRNLNPTLVVKPEKLEITSLLAGSSLLVLLIGGVFSLLWFSRMP
jgi:Ca-activated chloride channel homolog